VESLSSSCRKVAFERARLDLVKYLLDKESDSTVKDRYSFALHYAVEYDWIDVVRHLLDRGVEINSLWNSETALCCACRHGHLNIVQLLLQRGADPYLHGSYVKHDLLPIQIAYERGPDSSEGLLFANSSSYRMSSSTEQILFCRNHPLHIAYDNGQWDIIELLLNLGFNVDSWIKMV
jgi:ankyrin repeat protein